MQVDHLIIDANIATMNPIYGNGYGHIENAALAIHGERIVWLGSMAELPEDIDLLSTPITSAKGQWLTPGLIDCHTHLVFAGNRAGEFERRLEGESYQSIAASGGGIATTVKATRDASREHLFVSAKRRLNALFDEGVTTVEVKSGYGLDTDSEVKILEVAQQLQAHHPVDVHSTFLGAHALPTEYKDDAQGYIDLVCEQMLPQIAKNKLASAVDVFCESVGFSLAHTEQVFAKASELGLRVKLHGEQLSNMGGSTLAAKYCALSSDHLEYLDEAGIKAMKAADMTAVLLPGAFYYLRETQLPPLALLREHQVPIALATDFNPGTSPLCSLQLMMNMACTLWQMTPEQSLAGVTRHAAKALGLNDRGMLDVGMRADLALWNIQHPAQLSYEFGLNPLDRLWVAGKMVKG